MTTRTHERRHIGRDIRHCVVAVADGIVGRSGDPSLLGEVRGEHHT